MTAVAQELLSLDLTTKWLNSLKSKLIVPVVKITVFAENNTLSMLFSMMMVM